MSPGGQVCRVVLLSAVLLLLSVERAKLQDEDLDLKERIEENEEPSTDQNQEVFEEHFKVPSIGETWQEVQMTKQEELMFKSKSASVYTYVFDLAFCFNLASIMVFL